MSALFHLAAAAAETAHFAGGSDPDIPWVRIILAFLFCIALAIAAIGFIRVRNGMPLMPDRLGSSIAGVGDGTSAPSDRLQITQRLTLSPNSQVIVLKRGEQNYLLHVGANGATEIDRFNDEAEDAQG